MKNFSKYFATLFGIGFISLAPGTFGSLFAILIWYVFIDLFSIFYFIVLFLYVLSVSFYFTDIYLDNYKKKDPSEVIVDEFIGQSIPIYLYEISHETEKSPDEAIIFYGICFILFRFFDIKKPFPVSFFDKNYKNSFGVIMDDICAGFYVVLSLICFMIFKSYFI